MQHGRLVGQANDQVRVDGHVGESRTHPLEHERDRRRADRVEGVLHRRVGAAESRRSERGEEAEAEGEEEEAERVAALLLARGVNVPKKLAVLQLA